MVKAGLLDEVRAAVEVAASPIKVGGVRIDEGQTYASEDVLYISVDLPPGTGPLPGPRYVGILSSLNETLLRLGEERTPLLRMIREDEESPAESEAARG